MSDTPRTDKVRADPDTEYTDMCGLAEELERELAAMTAAKNKAVEALKKMREVLVGIREGRLSGYRLEAPASRAANLIAELEAT